MTQTSIQLGAETQHSGRNLVRKSPVGVFDSIYYGRKGQVKCLAGTNAAEDVQRRLSSDRPLDHLAEHTCGW